MRTRYCTPSWPAMRSPGSRARSVHTCQGLRPRWVGQALAVTRLSLLPSANGTASAPGRNPLSRLDGRRLRRSRLVLNQRMRTDDVLPGGLASGLAWRILESSYRLKIPRMFAALVLASATGIAIFLLLTLLSPLLLRHWHESSLAPER